MSLPADQLTRLIALSDGPLVSLARRVCAATISLPALPVSAGVAVPESDVSEVEAAVAEFAEQFSADVSMITDEQRARLFKHLGDSTLRTVIAIFVADFVPRVRVGLEALGVGTEYLGWVDGPIPADVDGEVSDELFNRFLPGVARERALDPVTSELVRLRGAQAHNCRLCKSLREANALDAGGSDALYDEISQFETSILLDDRAKAALRYADALIWSPAHLAVDDAVEVRSRFSADEAVELTFDIMRNASNKIAVSLGADAARVESGTERYLIDVDGQTVYS
jgi:alkylhydroperoxidase family enzyme